MAASTASNNNSLSVEVMLWAATGFTDGSNIPAAEPAPASLRKSLLEKFRGKEAGVPDLVNEPLWFIGSGSLRTIGFSY